MKHIYTPEQVEFIRRNLPGRSHAELTDMFNRHFALTLTCQQVTAAAKNRKIRNGRDTRIKPGSIPHNKGKPGHHGGEATQFRKGNKPWNYHVVGTERINGEGYTEVKVTDPKKWRAKHVMLWEAEHGPVPKGHVVIFGDGDRRNLSLDNLILISRRELAVMNKRGLIGNSPELTLAGKAVADIYLKIGERRRKRA